MATRNQNEFLLDSLYGQNAVSNQLMQRSMKDLEKELNRQFKEQAKDEMSYNAQMQKIHRPFHELVSKNSDADQVVKRIKEFDRNDYKRKIVIPRPPLENQRIFTGSIGATVIRPYNYDWRWNAISGGSFASVTASRVAGNMSFSLTSGGTDNSYNSSGRSAVGIFFRPPTENGILDIWSNPSFNYHWWTHCAFATGHSDAFIGLYVGRYNLSGGFDGAPVNQRISLWNDTSWWSGAGSHTGSNSGFGLRARLGVDRSHYYAIWVWCGGTASGAGSGFLYAGYGGSTLSVTVPSIGWELF